jgi:outer membrane protein TolC
MRIAIIIISLLTAGLRAEPLSLEDYLGQVREQGPSYKTARLQTESASDRRDQSRLLTSPYGFASWAANNDRSESLSPQTEGDSRSGGSFKAGIEEQTPIGLNGRAWYETTFYTLHWRTNYYNPAPSAAPPEDFTSYQPSLNFLFSLDLLKNGFGREVRLNQQAIREGARAEAAGRTYEQRALLVQAEILYWTLNLTREVVRSQEEILERSERIYAWTSEKASRKLADESSILQSRSDVQFRRLELSQAREQERAVAMKFNLLRGQTGPSVAETLSAPSASNLAVPVLPDDPPVRGDVTAELLSSRARIAKTEADRNGLLPGLNLFVQGSFRGLDEDGPEALKEAASFKNPVWTIGAELRSDLDIPSRLRLNRGLKKEAEARRTEAERKQQELASDWTGLKLDLEAAERHLKLASELEQTQQTKADLEHERLKTGRTVTAQVLLFEQDLIRSRLNRINTELELLRLIAQTRLYGGPRP